jgi:hypothetical protein
MPIVAGVDGCKTGWLCVVKDSDTGLVTSAVYNNAQSLIQQEPKPSIIAVDIPIGLTETGPRLGDKEARHSRHILVSKRMQYGEQLKDWEFQHNHLVFIIKSLNLTKYFLYNRFCRRELKRYTQRFVSGLGMISRQCCIAKSLLTAEQNDTIWSLNTSELKL